MLKDIGVDLSDYANADDIAAELMGDAVTAGRDAQRIVVERRATALQSRKSFTYETVMSHHSHIEAMNLARENGFFVRLFFISTDDPAINVARVADRVAKGGHDVPIDRIVARYYRTLTETLFPAICAADETLVFDTTFDPSIGPLRVAHIIGRFARLWPDHRIAWPTIYLFPKIQADPDFIIAPA